jgi:hypothetical protein
MDLKTSLTGLLDAQHELQTPQGISNPTTLSEQMMRLAAYTSSVEEFLAGLERDFELAYHSTLRRWLDAGEKVTGAERATDIELSDLKAQIRYLSRMVSSAWKMVSIIQSRINHLTKESSTTNF